jgi:hypothetical protein
MEDLFFMLFLLSVIGEDREVEEVGYNYEILDSVPLTNINTICLVVQ